MALAYYTRPDERRPQNCGETKETSRLRKIVLGDDLRGRLVGKDADGL